MLVGAMSSLTQTQTIMTQEEVKQIADAISKNIAFCIKETLTSDEAARYMGITKAWLYKLTMRKQIPYYKATGKMCYFKRQELDQWLQSCRTATENEIEQQAQTYCMRKGGRV